MDDGSVWDSQMYLHTQGFVFSDQELLRDVLKEKFGIRTNIHKDKTYYKLYIVTDSTSLFVNLIKPYILPCFEYKLPIKKITNI